MEIIGLIIDLSLEYEDIENIEMLQQLIDKISWKQDAVAIVEASSAGKVFIDERTKYKTIALVCNSPDTDKIDEHRMTFYSNIYNNCNELYIITSIENEAIEHWISNYVVDDKKVTTTYLR